MIEFRDIVKSYGTKEVLNHMNVTFEEGDLCMLLGPSGCGKSTMIKLINRLIEPDRGQILIQGQEARGIQPEALRLKMGYAIQGVGLFPHMTVRENIGVVPKLLKWDKRKITNRVEELMDLMGIPETYGDKKPYMLSGGEAQRIGVARALGADPEILLMDEPFGALDPVTRTRLQDEFMILQKKLNKTVVFVTHDIGEAVRMADDLILMNEGRIVAKGRPESFTNKGETLTRSFFGDRFTYELLDKYRLQDYRSVLKELDPKEMSTWDEPESIRVTLKTSVTFREVLTYMLEKGEDHLLIEDEGKVFGTSFAALARVFQGGTL